jgi:hypothetical protein
MDRDRLEALLSESAPRDERELSGGRIEAMIARSRTDARAAGRLGWLRNPRVAIAGAAAIVLFGGAGAAAAATYDDWAPWAQDPDLAYTYTLPSGAECEQRLGEVYSGDPELTAAVRDIMRNGDVVARADIDKWIGEIRAGKNTRVLDDGTEVPAGYGTAYYSADQEYDSAMSQAISEVIGDDLRDRGFNEDPGADNLQWSGQGYCPGADW